MMLFTMWRIRQYIVVIIHSSSTVIVVIIVSIFYLSIGFLDDQVQIILGALFFCWTILIIRDWGYKVREDPKIMLSLHILKWRGSPIRLLRKCSMLVLGFRQLILFHSCVYLPYLSLVIYLPWVNQLTHYLWSIETKFVDQIFNNVFI